MREIILEIEPTLKQGKKPGGRGFTDINPDYPFRTWFLGPVLAYNFYEHHYPTMLNWIGQLNIDKDKDLRYESDA